MSDSATNSLNALLQAEPRLWRARDARARQTAVRPTGHARLDAALPGGGWPETGMIEVVVEARQPPPLHPFLPAMADCTRVGQRIVLVDAPADLVPFTPAWQQAGINPDGLLLVRSDDRANAWWVIETALRSEACGLVLAWPCTHGRQVDVAAMRRWQVAAAAGRCLGVLFTPARRRAHAPNVHLRLHVQGDRLRVLKARGSHQCPVVSL